jgi:hypothetical protein
MPWFWIENEKIGLIFLKGESLMLGTDLFDADDLVNGEVKAFGF